MTGGEGHTDLLAPYDALLLLSFGGPEAPDEVMPFLRRVTAGRGIPDERLASVAHHYDLFGGRSPINDQNRALIAALEAELKQREIVPGPAVPLPPAPCPLALPAAPVPPPAALPPAAPLPPPVPIIAPLHGAAQLFWMQPTKPVKAAFDEQLAPGIAIPRQAPQALSFTQAWASLQQLASKQLWQVAFMSLTPHLGGGGSMNCAAQLFCTHW